MAFEHGDLVLETTTTTGTGTLTLAGAVTGHLTFAAEIGEGNTCAYTIEASNGQKETGVGTVGSGTLARTTLKASSTGSKLDLPAGTHYVGVTANSESFTPSAIGAQASVALPQYPVEGMVLALGGTPGFVPEWRDPSDWNINMLGSGTAEAGWMLAADGSGAAGWYSKSGLGFGGAAVLNVGTATGTVAAGDDSRLSNSRTPTAHASSHASGQADAIKLDDLAAPDNNTDLDASTSAHGLVVKATAPAAGLLNVVGISNGETAYTNKTIPNFTAITAQASADIAAGDLVNLYTVTGALRVQKADGGGTTKPANGYVLAAITSGNSGAVYAYGVMTGLTGLTPGGDCWLSQATAGAVTQTAPNEATTGKIIQLVGKAISASTMLFQPGQAVLT